MSLDARANYSDCRYCAYQFESDIEIAVLILRTTIFAPEFRRAKHALSKNVPNRAADETRF